MSLDIIREYSLDTFAPNRPDQGGLEEVLESGKVLYFPRLAFSLAPSEQRFLSEQWSDGKAKNISFRGATEPLRGARGEAADIELLRQLLARYADSAARLVAALFPRYQGYLRQGFTSFRPVSAAGRKTSWRKDDSRLHVDAFPSNPTGGVRLLRVFTNVNPEGVPRVWRVGESFETFAGKFYPRVSRPLPGSAWLLKTLGLTKSRRSEYDHIMLQLHDRGKADLDYQAHSPQETFPFPPGSTWVVYSDQVQHAVLSGQYMFEQTFYLEPAHLVRPELGPLAVLERLAGKALLQESR